MTAAVRAIWDEALHPRDLAGRWAEKAREADAAAAEQHSKAEEESLAGSLLAGGRLHASRRLAAARHLRHAARALRAHSAAKASRHLAAARRLLAQIPASGGYETDPGADRLLGKLALAGAVRAWSPAQPRDGAGRWARVADRLSALADQMGGQAGSRTRRAAGAVRRGDRETAIGHLAETRRLLDTARGPAAAGHRVEADRHLAALMQHQGEYAPLSRFDPKLHPRDAPVSRWSASGLAAELRRAAVHGTHVPGTPYHYRHGWIPVAPYFKSPGDLQPGDIVEFRGHKHVVMSQLQAPDKRSGAYLRPLSTFGSGHVAPRSMEHYGTARPHKHGGVANVTVKPGGGAPTGYRPAPGPPAHEPAVFTSPLTASPGPGQVPLPLPSSRGMGTGARVMTPEGKIGTVQHMHGSQAHVDVHGKGELHPADMLQVVEAAPQAREPGHGKTAGQVRDGKWKISATVKAGDSLMDGNGDRGTVAGVSADGRWVAAQWDHTHAGGRNRREIIDRQRGEVKSTWYAGRSDETPGVGQDWIRVVNGGVPRGESGGLGTAVAGQAAKERAAGKLAREPGTAGHAIAANDAAFGLAGHAAPGVAPDGQEILDLFPPLPGESPAAYRRRLGQVPPRRFAEAKQAAAAGRWDRGSLTVKPRPLGQGLEGRLGGANRGPASLPTSPPGFESVLVQARKANPPPGGKVYIATNGAGTSWFWGVGLLPGRNATYWVVNANGGVTKHEPEAASDTEGATAAAWDDRLAQQVAHQAAADRLIKEMGPSQSRPPNGVEIGNLFPRLGGEGNATYVARLRKITPGQLAVQRDAAARDAADAAGANRSAASRVADALVFSPTAGQYMTGGEIWSKFPPVPGERPADYERRLQEMPRAAFRKNAGSKPAVGQWVNVAGGDMAHQVQAVNGSDVKLDDGSWRDAGSVVPLLATPAFDAAPRPAVTPGWAKSAGLTWNTHYGWVNPDDNKRLQEGSGASQIAAQAKDMSPEGDASKVAVHGHAISTAGAALAAHLDSGIVGSSYLGEGAQGSVDALQTGDGATVVRKRLRDAYEWSADDMTDAEYYSALTAAAIGGTGASPVLRGGPDEIYENLAPGDIADNSDEDMYDMYGTPQGLRIGLLDWVISNGDRHGANWMISDGKPVPIDMSSSYGTIPLDGWGDNEFTSAYAQAVNAGDPPLSLSELNGVEKRFEAVRKEFEDGGRGDWWVAADERLHDVMAATKAGHIDTGYGAY